MSDHTDIRNREEHLAWAKERAIALLDAGNVTEAFTSMASDLGKHYQTANHPGIQLGMGLLLLGDLSTPQKMREFIEGFN